MAASSATSYEYILAITHFFGFTTVLLNGYFFNTFRDGLTWPTKQQHDYYGIQFHGFLMVLGFVFFQGEALLSYRIYRYEPKIISKLIHGILHFLAISLGITALIAIIINKNLGGNKHFYSIHSWIGVCLLTVYILQFTFGFFTFLMPCASVKHRARLIPIHRAIGASLLILAAIQCVVGYVTFLSFDTLPCFSTLSCNNRMEYVASFAVLTLILYTLLVLALIIPQSWKRQKTPDEIK
ncbi:unnamed protein product [Caenorhabditis angaria]|uniref:Cytochrome b561 domain-containing protein n=1 Tax=Caenorhabditis angaria TaxID=860376 RepID=A0A9P1N3L7_9PELO|nr:unnamed protein product [Caenorhabditis angaria]